MTKRTVVHLSVTKPNRFGGSTTRSLCNRNALTDDGMNLGDESEVTCKFCLAIMARK